MDCGRNRVTADLAPELAQALAPFDEAALAVLANKGLARRAARDVEAGLVALAAVEGGTAVVAADGETVRLDAHGPARARCTCPAPGLCRHRLAATLFLRAAEPAQDDSNARMAALLAEAAAVPEAALQRFAGKAGWRAALDIADGASVALDGAALAVTLIGEDLALRFLAGQGVDGVVSKVSAARRKAAHTAALIAIRRRAGLEPAAPGDEPQADAPATVDPAALEEIRATLADAARTGLSLGAIAVEERLFALSVSSRADAMPRLARLLRGVAADIRRRRERALAYDPDAALGRLATADALARALARDGGDAGVRGAVRGVFDRPAPPLLHALAGEDWATPGGRGVTAHLYDPAGDRWYTATLARGPGQDPAWRPAHAWSHEGVWSGLPMAKLIGRAVSLRDGAAAANGRLSLAAGVGASVAPGGDLCALDAVDDWAALQARLRERLAGTLRNPAPPVEPVLLRPRRAAPPWFDDLAQRLVWPLTDGGGRWLALTVERDAEEAALFERIGALLADAQPEAVVALATLSGEGMALRPLAVQCGGKLLQFRFDAPPPRTLLGGWLAKFGRGAPPFAPAPPDRTRALLEAVASELTGIAEVGGRALGDAGAARLARLAARVDDAGLPTLADLLKPAGTSAAALLAARYATDQYRRRMAVLPWLARR